MLIEAMVPSSDRPRIHIGDEVSLAIFFKGAYSYVNYGMGAFTLSKVTLS